MMTEAFLGEIELSDDNVLPNKFEPFECLTNINTVHALASQFAGRAEIMPYKRQGEGVELLVSVYLRPRDNSGRVVAILVREHYPASSLELKRLIEKGLRRLNSFSGMLERYEAESISEAKATLQKILNSIL